MSTVALRARAIELYSTDRTTCDRVGGTSGHTRASQPVTTAPIFRKAACPCGGGCPACQANSSDLNISQPNDPAEIEADQIADRVMRMPIDEGASVMGDKRQAAPGKERILQRQALPSNGSAPIQASGHVQSALSSGGVPLHHQTRSFFESRLGYDLSPVRIHIGDAAFASAQAMQARAYTLGTHLVFAKDEYRPEADVGKKLLAHELAHVLQQTTGKIQNLQRQRAGDSVTGGSSASLPIGEDLCSEAHEAEAREALNNAYHWIRRTIHRINSDHGGTEADLRYYFGDSYDRGAIILRLGELQEFIREGVVLTCADPSSDPECRPSVLAYARSPYPLISRIFNDRIIHVCQPNFHEVTEPIRIATMVHEASHNYLGTDDHVTYSDVDCRAETAARLSDRALSENADSYGCLVYRLGRRDP